ncbi:MAG: hypothetical protein CMM25_08065 [Rhodospirillaceae bacterium]|nr:hypothetical protein [Rhodospirillaceae bacterium]
MYLDTEERKRFAQMSHEYLIDQLQFTGSEPLVKNSSAKIRLNFNHPVKELIWYSKTKNLTNPNTTLGSGQELGGGAEGADANITLTLNGHDRFEPREGRYFTVLQKYYHHSADARQFSYAVNGKFVGVYSFALRPEEHQPSGTCNFSRIDNATLSIGDTGPNYNISLPYFIDVFAINYNVLRVVSGMGGLAYSN